MKILYVITKSNWGGAQRYVCDIATAMQKDGHEVTVALGGAGMLKTKLESAGIRAATIASLQRDVSVVSDTASLKQIYSIIKTERPDVLHLNSPKAAGLGAFAGRLLRVPTILQTVHGWTFNEDRPFYQRAAIHFFSWLTTLLCHKTIVLSEREYKQALRFPFVKNNKLALIPLGIEVPTFISQETAQEVITQKAGVKATGNIIVGTIAELHPNKGLRYLIEAMAKVIQQHQNASCVIIGEGQERAALESLIKERRLERVVSLAGYLDEASRYLKAFDIFVLPSIKEGLPYVLLEAGLASLPVAATNVGSVPEIIENKKSGLLVQPKDSTELANAISFMIEHPKERDAYGAALHAHVESKFSFEKMISETVEVYRK